VGSVASQPWARHQATANRFSRFGTQVGALGLVVTLRHVLVRLPAEGDPEATLAFGQAGPLPTGPYHGQGEQPFTSGAGQFGERAP
jgi:hypothetical protein